MQYLVTRTCKLTVNSSNYLFTFGFVTFYISIVVCSYPQLRDANEGADFIMVKPGTPYLDILSELRRQVISFFELIGLYVLGFIL